MNPLELAGLMLVSAWIGALLGFGIFCVLATAKESDDIDGGFHYRRLYSRSPDHKHRFKGHTAI